uniref:(northern house mosquito) hypothetical protein n=1 Tax=Culex pipiens TaxID=7175 RepID=A0A8D8PF19_CULPI
MMRACGEKEMASCVSCIHDVQTKERKQTRRSFRCSFRPVPRGNRFNPFLVSDSAQWTFVADLCRCLIVYVDLSLLHSKPVNTRKAFVCEKTVEHFFSCLSLALSIALVIFGSTTKTKTLTGSVSALKQQIWRQCVLQCV